MTRFRAAIGGALLACCLAGQAGAVPVEELVDLGGAARPIVTLKGRDNFSNEFRYEVKIKNNTPDPLPAGALVLVLDRVTDLAGKEALPRMEVVEKDGTTQEGRPYFTLPPSQGLEVAPYSESEPVTVRLKNVDYTVVFTPTFRILGPRPAAPSGALSELIQLLIKKGVLTEEEWRTIHRRAKRGTPP